MKRIKIMGLGAALALLFAFVACNGLESPLPEAEIISASSVDRPGNNHGNDEGTGSGNSTEDNGNEDGAGGGTEEGGGTENNTPKVIVTNPRYGATLDSISSDNTNLWNKILPPNTAPYLGFDAESESGAISSVTIVLKELLNMKEGISWKITASARPNGNSYWAPSKTLGTGTWRASIVATDKNGNKSEEVAFPNIIVDPSAVEPKEPRISNFRWNSTGEVAIADKAKWNPERIDKGSQLWFGLDTTEVATSIVFMVYKNSVLEKYTMTPTSHPNSVGLGNENGLVWAKFPTTIDVECNLRIRVDVNFIDGTSETLSGSLKVTNPPYTLGDLRRIEFEDLNLPKELKPTNFNAEYYEFGRWPQSLKYDHITVDHSVKDTAGFMKGSDGEWYTRITALNNDYKAYTTNDGTRKMHYGFEYYFKVEPITWVRIPGTNKLMSTKILDQRPVYGIYPEGRYTRVNTKPQYYQAGMSWWNHRTIEMSNYYYSDIRAWLNSIENPSRYKQVGWRSWKQDINQWMYTIDPVIKTGAEKDYRGDGFYEKAFTTAQKNMIEAIPLELTNKDSHVDAIDKTHYPKWESFINDEDATDKVWLWSKREVTTPAYGFNGQGKMGFDTNRRKVITDYALARGVHNGSDPGNRYTYGNWWLRSPNWEDGSYMQAAAISGHANSHTVRRETLHTDHGVVPGIQLPASMLNQAERKAR